NLRCGGGLHSTRRVVPTFRSASNRSRAPASIPRRQWRQAPKTTQSQNRGSTISFSKVSPRGTGFPLDVSSLTNREGVFIWLPCGCAPICCLNWCLMHTSQTPVRIAMWSGPRNISTAMMRAWGNRRDTVVIDEPFYAYYLRTTGKNHPGADEVIAAGEID